MIPSTSCWPNLSNRNEEKDPAIVLIYAVVAVICAGILGVSMWLRATSLRKHHGPAAECDTGKETRRNGFPFSNDLAARQPGQPAGQTVRPARQGMAGRRILRRVCPKCAARNGSELREIYDDIQEAIRISISPAFRSIRTTTSPTKLADYAKALGADTKNWWFLNAGDVQEDPRLSRT